MQCICLPWYRGWLICSKAIYNYALQAKQWGQYEAEYSNFKLQPGHGRPVYIAKHGALPTVLTADNPPAPAALPPWCSLDVTPGPGAYELRKEEGSEAALTAVQRSAFGATGDGKGPR